MIDNSPQKQLEDLNKEIEKGFESIGKSVSERQADVGKSIVKKYNQIERPIQDELDRIDSELHDTSIATDDIGVHIPFGRIMPGGGISYDYVYVGGQKHAVTAEKTSNFLQVNNDGTTEWVVAMPDVMPTNAEVYDVTKNEIHLPGEMAE